MTLKDKMKTYNFWISLVSAILLIVQVVGDKYGFSVDSGLVIDITTGVCGIFVILGIISSPQKIQINSEKGDINTMENTTGEDKNADTLKNDNAISGAVGRYQNILLAMKQKAQNHIVNIENMVQNTQNEAIVLDSNVENTADEFDVVDSVNTDHVIAEQNGSGIDDTIVVECNDEVTEDVLGDNSTQSNTQVSLEVQNPCDDSDESDDELLFMISELSDDERAELISLLQG